MRTLLLALIVSGLSGCLTPRSAVFGQTATTLGPGNAEVALSMGGSYARLSAPQALDTSSTSNLFTVPDLEANVAFGLSDSLDLNVHLSSAGIQPGVKVVLSTGEWNLAVVPELAFLYSGNNSASNGTNARSLLLGAKLLASNTAGLYAGFGYDLRLLERGAVAGTGTSSSSSLSHFGGLAVGYELKMGGLKLRPELAVAFAPVFSLEDNAPEGIGTELIILPNITIAVGGSTKSASPRSSTAE